MKTSARSEMPSLFLEHYQWLEAPMNLGDESEVGQKEREWPRWPACFWNQCMWSGMGNLLTWKAAGRRLCCRLLCESCVCIVDYIGGSSAVKGVTNKLGMTLRMPTALPCVALSVSFSVANSFDVCVISMTAFIKSFEVEMFVGSWNMPPNRRVKCRSHLGSSHFDSKKMWEFVSPPSCACWSDWRGQRWRGEDVVLDRWRMSWAMAALWFHALMRMVVRGSLFLKKKWKWIEFKFDGGGGGVRDELRWVRLLRLSGLFQRSCDGWDRGFWFHCGQWGARVVSPIRVNSSTLGSFLNETGFGCDVTIHWKCQMHVFATRPVARHVTGVPFSLVANETQMWVECNWFDRVAWRHLLPLVGLLERDPLHMRGLVWWRWQLVLRSGWYWFRLALGTWISSSSLRVVTTLESPWTWLVADAMPPQSELLVASTFTVACHVYGVQSPLSPKKDRVQLGVNESS